MFNCNQCSSVFARKDNLVRHVKTHGGERFPCIVCGKLFTYKSNLNKHLRNVHGMYIYYLIFLDINIYLIFLFFPKISFRLIVNPLERALFNLRLVLPVQLNRTLSRLHLKYLSPISQPAVQIWCPTMIYVCLLWMNMRIKTWVIQVSFIYYPWIN